LVEQFVKSTGRITQIAPGLAIHFCQHPNGFILFIENKNPTSYQFKFTFEIENLFSQNETNNFIINPNSQEIMKYYCEDILKKCSFKYKF
jgi:hypothetical protein